MLKFSGRMWGMKILLVYEPLAPPSMGTLKGQKDIIKSD